MGLHDGTRRKNWNLLASCLLSLSPSPVSASSGTFLGSLSQSPSTIQDCLNLPLLNPSQLCLTPFLHILHSGRALSLQALHFVRYYSFLLKPKPLFVAMATATAARNFSKAFPRSAVSAASSIRLAARPSRANAAKKFFQQSSRRQYSSGPTPQKSKTNLIVGATAVAVLLGGGGYIYGSQSSTPEVHLKQGSGGQSVGVFKPTTADYQKVYDAIAKALWEHDEYEDGSYGPVLLRLAWHSSGTYDAATQTGGSNGATMRFAPEGDHGANAGLKVARDFLEPIKGKH